MSRIFDVLTHKTEKVSISANWAGQHMRMMRTCYRGPNRFLMPQFTGNPPGIQYASNIETFKKADEVGNRNVSDMHHFKISYASDQVTALHAPVRQFTEASTLGSTVGGVVVFEPLNLQNTNSATYYVRLKAQCRMHSQITIDFDDGGSLEFVGEIELHSDDPRTLRFRAQLPPNSKLVASYSQVLRVRDSILKKLSRMHYGKDPFQPQSL